VIPSATGFTLVIVACKECMLSLMPIGPSIILKTEDQIPTRCHLLFYYDYVRRNMFRAPLCSSSGAHDDSVGNTTLSCYSLRSGHLSILHALNFQPAATREPDGLCSNQRYRRELLMMSIMVPETCCA